VKILVIGAAGDGVFRPLFDLSDADFALCLGNKLMGQEAHDRHPRMSRAFRSTMHIP
jgi:hypothetical protein